MIERDKRIIQTLEKFRVLRRDDIIDLFFVGGKYPISQANRTLKRLRRDGYVTCSPDAAKQYVYFPVPSIRKDSQKIPHFLEIVNVYKALAKAKPPRRFEVEPKVGGKGTIEPDIFTIWKGTPIFVEIQRNVYTKKVMTRKLNKYKAYYLGGTWKDFDWQPADRKLFPLVLFITNHTYHIDVPFRTMQVADIGDFINGLK